MYVAANFCPELWVVLRNVFRTGLRVASVTATRANRRQRLHPRSKVRRMSDWSVFGMPLAGADRADHHLAGPFLEAPGSRTRAADIVLSYGLFLRKWCDEMNETSDPICASD
jgi:hypothetical protein